VTDTGQLGDHLLEPADLGGERGVVGAIAAEMPARDDLADLGQLLSPE
jgi:hypothetical protein